MSNIAMVCVIIILIALSAYFSATETAFSSVNTIRLKNLAEKGNKSAKTAVGIIDEYDSALTTILIGNNIVNIGSSSLSTVLCLNLFGDYGAAISTGIITIIILIFGEITPKSVAKETAESFCLKSAPILHVLMILLHPLSYIFIKIKLLAMKIVTHGREDSTPSVTEDELHYIVDSIEEEGVLEEQESELVRCALEFDEKTVHEVLTPRVDMTAIDIDDDPKKNRDIIMEERYSRIPVYKDSIDNIIGILHTRDYLEVCVNGKQPNISKLIKPAFLIYKTKKLSFVLSVFKHKKLHIAIVTDEYGGTLGIVTMEDLLEELVGDIWDEDEEIETQYQKAGVDSFDISADMDIDEMLELFDLNEDLIDSESVSVGGWILELLGHIPRNGDCFTYEGLEITIKNISDQRIKTVNIRKIPDYNSPESD